LAAAVASIGAGTTLEQLRAVRWALPGLIAVSLLKHGLRTKAWQLVLRAERVPVPFWRLFQIRVASNSVSYLSGLGVAGDPLKSWLLRRSAPLEATMPATLVEAGAYWLTSLFIGLAGAAAALGLVSGTKELALAAAVCGGALVLACAFFLYPRPVTPKAGRALLRVAPSGLRAKVSGWLERASEMEARFRTFRLRHGRVALYAAGLNLLVQALKLSEIVVVLTLAGAAPGAAAVLAIEGMERLINTLTFFVPGRLGVYELGSAGAFALLGLDPAAGLTLALARRIQGLAMAGAGLVPLNALGWGWAPATPPGRKPAPAAPPEG